jgi:hypothetical protein
VRPLLELLKPPIRLQEGLLHHVLRIVLVARHSIGQPEHLPAVPLDEGLEGAFVAGTRPGHIRGVSSVHPLHETASLTRG